jgi:type IV pilus assembly protein PilC
MPTFRYQALNAEEQLVSGELEADSVAQALAQLESSGLVVQSIGYATIESAYGNRRSDEGIGQSPFRTDSTPAGENMARAVLQRHLERVLERGRAIAPALRAFAQEMSAGRRRRELITVAKVLERGDGAEAARALHGLPTYWIPLLGAATSSSDPGRILREFVKESERADELRRQWWLALAYPVFLAFVGIGVVVALSFLVIPIFREIFWGFGLKLPLLTQLTLTLAAWITSGEIALWVLLALLSVWLLRQAARLLPQGLRHWLSDRSPIVIGHWTTLARFSQFTADLLEAELDIPGAVRVGGFASNNSRLARSASRLANDIESGVSLPRHEGNSVLSAAVRHALRAEMQPRPRIRLLSELSQCYSERARHNLSWTCGFIEPLAICLIGVVVGGAVLALFLPLLTLIQALSG